METYIILGRYTQQGVAKIKEGPTRGPSLRYAPRFQAAFSNQHRQQPLRIEILDAKR